MTLNGWDSFRRTGFEKKQRTYFLLGKCFLNYLYWHSYFLLSLFLCYLPIPFDKANKFDIEMDGDWNYVVNGCMDNDLYFEFQKPIPV